MTTTTATNDVNVERENEALKRALLQAVIRLEQLVLFEQAIRVGVANIDYVEREEIRMIPGRFSTPIDSSVSDLLERLEEATTFDMCWSRNVPESF